MKEKRELLGLSQEDLAKKVSVSRQTISYIENGLKYPDLAKAFEIARVLQTGISDLFIQYPAVQDLLRSLDPNEVRSLWSDLGLNLNNLRDEKVTYDALEQLPMDKVLALATRMNVDPEMIFEFNFEEKKAKRRIVSE